jgi:parallel beta-helix repeat protein
MVVLAGPLAGATYRVSADGDDGGPGTQDQPFRTIARAAQVARPGDEVVVASGTYHEVVNIGGYPDASERTVLRAEEVGGVILRGQPGEKDGERQTERCRVVVRRPNVTLVGFDVRDTTEHAVEFVESPGGIADRCVFRDNDLDGVFFHRQDGGRAENCIAAHNGRHGIWFHQMQNGTAVSNTLHGNDVGIAVSDSPGVVVFNNVVAHNGTGLRVTGESSRGLRTDHNLHVGGVIGHLSDARWTEANAGTLADWRELTGQEEQSVWGDPLFVAPDACDLRLSAPPTGVWSPAAMAGLWAAEFAGQQAPATDWLGRAPEAGVIRAVGALYAESAGRGAPLATVKMPFEGRLSVGVFDASGQMVRELLRDYPARMGPRDLYWDGRDDGGDRLPPGGYEWRATAHQIRGVDDGSVGDSGDPPYGKTHVPTGISSIAVDAEGSYYTTTFWDEAGFDIVKYSAEGETQWVPKYYVRNVAGGYGQVVATDGEYVFVGLARNVREEGGNRFISDQIRRLDCGTGEPADFPVPAGSEPPQPNEGNVIVVNDVKEQPWVPHQQLDTEASRRMFAIRGLACDATRVWVGNHFRSTVEAYDKATGAKLSEFPVDRPMGLSVAPDGNLWVCLEGHRVAEFAPEGRPTGRQVPGLEDPYGATFGGLDGHLYVAELGAGRVLEYDVTGPAPRQVRSFGRKAGGPGRVLAEVFWDGPQGLAVDGQGRITLSDPGTARILRYTPDLKLWHSYTSDFVTAPFVDERTPDVLISNDRQYRVDYGTGAWEFTYNWSPGKGVRRTLPNGRDYLFELGGHRMGVVVWAIEGDGDALRVRKCAMVGGRWMGVDDLGEGKQAVKYSWQDTSGDGRVQEEEMIWETHLGDDGYHMSALGPGWWVDAKGDLWLCDQVTRSIIRFPLLGFDEHGSPRYEWARSTTVVPTDASAWHFQATNLKTTLDGDLYVQGTVEGNRDMKWFWMGGTAVARFGADGARRWLRVLPRTAVSIAADGAFWYTGEGNTAKVTMYTDDGLMLCEMSPGRPSGYVSGWIDHALGLYAFRHPTLKRHYVYAEEDYYGKSIRYRIEGIETLKRFAGKAEVPQ